MDAYVEPRPGEERAWWLRTLLVLQSPRPVFAALRDESEQALNARQDPVTALVLLCGLGAILAAPSTGRQLDDRAIDGILVAVLAFLAGGLYGGFGYWIGGGALSLGTRVAGGERSYRNARHTLAFAAAPLALSLVLVWPLRLALYGGDAFRSGGADEGPLARALGLVELGLVAWMLLLLVIGIHVVYRLSWVRSIGAVLAAGGMIAGTILLLYLAS